MNHPNCSNKIKISHANKKSPLQNTSSSKKKQSGLKRTFSKLMKSNQKE